MAILPEPVRPNRLSSAPGLRHSRHLEPKQDLSPTPTCSVTPDSRSSSWLALSALSLLCLSSGAAAQTPPPEPYAGVVVLDDFANADRHTTHGELVEHEFNRGGANCEAPITSERHQVHVGVSMEALKRGEPGSLVDYIRQHFVVRVTNTAEALRELSALPGRRVFSQSQGASESRVFQAIWGQRENPNVLRELGLEVGSTDQEIAETLFQVVREVHTTDPTVRRAEAELDALSFSDIRTLSAGNQGQLYRELTDLGLELDETFFENALATPGTIVVGAAEQGGPAALASPKAGAHLAADGVEREMCVDGKLGLYSGSSYSQPQAARFADEFLSSDPTLSQQQILESMLAEVTPVPGEESRLGAGILPDWAESPIFSPR